MSASLVASRSASWTSMSSSEDVSSAVAAAAVASAVPEAVLTIEELRLQFNSCFTCGVSWQDDHVSLDCTECGGYSLGRPCPQCEGSCGAVWQRDVAASHATGRAAWAPAPCSARLRSLKTSNAASTASASS